MQRFGDLRLITGQVLARDRTADAVEIRGNLASDIATIEIVEAGVGEMRECRRKFLLLQRGADGGHLAVVEKRLGEARRAVTDCPDCPASAVPGCG